MMVRLKALVRAAWRAGCNDGWRFSRARAGLWALVLQVALAGLAMWRLASGPLELSPGTVLVVGFAEEWLMAFLMTLLRGRERYFAGPVVTLVHLSPAPARAFVLAQVVGALPDRAWRAMLFGCALLPAVRPAGPAPGQTALVLAGFVAAAIVGGAAGHLASIGFLFGAARRLPGALVVIPAAALVLLLLLVWGLLYLLLVGLDQLAAGAGAAPPPHDGAAWGAELALVALLSLPGLLMLAGELWTTGGRRRAADNDGFREAWLSVREALERGSRPLRSRWPALIGGPAGALQALAWLRAARNWFSLVRLGIWAAVLVAPFLLRVGLAGMPPVRASALYIGTGLTAALFNYGEQAAALFSVDGERAALPVLTGVTPGQLILGKWLSALPVVPVAALTTLAWARAGGRPVMEAAGLAGLSGAMALLSVTWLVGVAAFDAAPRARGPLAEGEQLAAAFEQAPTRPGGVAGLVGAAALAGCGIWLYLTAPRWIAALTAPAAAAAFAGWRWVARLWRRGAMG